jgi:hypothetical protein
MILLISEINSNIVYTISENNFFRYNISYLYVH